MSSPSLNRSAFVVDSVPPAIPQTPPEKTAERGADAAITARAIFAVTLLGAGIWFLLWKMALYFVAGH